MFMAFKLPSAYLCGIRVSDITKKACVVSVKHRWINQNPFKSMFWAVQGMAAEFSTGALMIDKVRACEQSISILVTSNKASFTKKATGRITFTCHDGDQADEVIKQAITKGEGQTIWMTSVGVNEAGVEVSRFSFEWSLKVKTPK